MTKKRKEADFSAEIIAKPKDFEQGEGLPREFKDMVEKRFQKGKRPQKQPPTAGQHFLIRK